MRSDQHPLKAERPMSRIACVLAAIIIAGTLTAGTACAQNPPAATSIAADRAAKAAAIRKKLPACKRQATAQALHLLERREFVRRCLRS